MQTQKTMSETATELVRKVGWLRDADRARFVEMFAAEMAESGAGWGELIRLCKKCGISETALISVGWEQDAVLQRMRELLEADGA